MANPRSTTERLAYLRLIRRYIRVLRSFTGTSVSAPDLIPYDQATIMAAALALSSYPCVDARLPIDAIGHRCFTDFLDETHHTNSSPVYILTMDSSVCGYFIAQDLRSLSFSPTLDTRDEVLSIVSLDSRDQLRIDYDGDVICVRAQGKHWPETARRHLINHHGFK